MKHYKYWFLEWILDEKAQKAYFCGANLNMLYQYDLEKNSVKSLGAFPHMPVSNQLFRGGVIYQNKLYFPPRMAARMGIYDIEKKEFRTKDIYAEIAGEKERFTPNDTGFISVKYQEKKAFFVYRSTPFCVVMDLEHESISYITCKETGDVSFLGMDYCIFGDFLISPIINRNKILFLNMKEETIEIRDLPINSDDSCCSFDLDDDGRLYLLTCKEPFVLSWNPWTNEAINETQLPLDSIIYEQGYWIRKSGNSIHIFPGLDTQGKNGRAFWVDLLTGQVKEISIFEKYKKYIKWSLISQNGKHIYAMVSSGQDIFFSDELIFVEYDWVHNRISERELPLPQDTSEQKMAQSIMSYQELVRFRYVIDYVLIYTENEYLPFSGWLNGFKRFDANNSDIKEISGIGKKIYMSFL
ncbi:hypothetical protein [Sporofaciens musculi]|uniref:hypothetical protein n=1 Tax=Sporofaciens musculi TaxID=2681861 RepID=UPI002589082B|nr:hypothetical protein [Sporofaciens musculi]